MAGIPEFPGFGRDNFHFTIDLFLFLWYHHSDRVAVMILISVRKTQTAGGYITL
jgi:hypothetical protein